MVSFIFRRLMHTIIVLILVSIIAFSLMHLIPGDPILTMLGQEATQAQIDMMRHEYWLDRPLIVQYVHWFTNVLRGELGTSITYRKSVAVLIAKRLPVTIHIGLIAFILSTFISIPAGVISAVRRGSLLDSFITVSANIGMAVPIFWLGILGIYLFSFKLGWLPVQGYTSPFDNFWVSTKQIMMPALCLAVVPLASLTRQARSSMLEVIRKEYMRTARSKGLKERAVIMGHGLKNAIIPIVTLLGLQLRSLVGGSVLVEAVF
ncbi:ABC transporter permease, partial [Thermodesulfobacteriota bacterium]